jgi:hypothetical protein
LLIHAVRGLRFITSRYSEGYCHATVVRIRMNYGSGSGKMIPYRLFRIRIPNTAGYIFFQNGKCCSSQVSTHVKSHWTYPSFIDYFFPFFIGSKFLFKRIPYPIFLRFFIYNLDTVLRYILFAFSVCPL